MRQSLALGVNTELRPSVQQNPRDEICQERRVRGWLEGPILLCCQVGKYVTIHLPLHEGIILKILRHVVEWTKTVKGSKLRVFHVGRHSAPEGDKQSQTFEFSGEQASRAMCRYGNGMIMDE